MLPNIVVIFMLSICIMETAAVDNKCPTLYNGSPIENCCDLVSTESTFSEVINQPKVYKLKNFCNRNCSTLTINGYCDTLTDGGGWLVVQRRIYPGSVSFNRSWVEYEKGFGNLTGELWYGLRALHCLTYSGNWEMRVDFTLSNRIKSYMHYNHFKVGPATDNYRLSISGFTGVTPSDHFVKSSYPPNGNQFSTYDRDNDKCGCNCALDGHGNGSGGWWHDNCNHMNLNYNYKLTGKRWGFILLGGHWHYPRFIEIKIRPKDCNI